MDIKNLSLEQKIGQLFMVEFQSTNLTEDEEAHFIKHNFANFIYFSKNLKDYKSIYSLSKKLQKVAQATSGIPAFIGLDQEGGMVTRIYSGATHFPSNMAITASKMFDKVKTIGEMVGEELFNLGINMNYAPCIDINNNPKNPVIGIRSYSDDPIVVSNMAVDYILGLQSKGILACAKHFPGHGDTFVDSHLDLPKVEYKMERLEEVELVPFKKVIQSGVDSIMSAHIKFTGIDNSDLPATLSKNMLTGLLRGKLNFEGLIITDSMQMKAIQDYYTTEKACVMSILAGANLICLCGDMKLQHNSYMEVLNAVNNGTIPIEVIDKSVERIIKYKEMRKISFDTDEKNLIEKYDTHEQLADNISENSITIVNDEKKLIPICNKKVFAISPPPINANIADEVLATKQSFSKYLSSEIGCEYKIISISPNQSEIENIVDCISNEEIIVIATYNAILNSGQIDLVNALTKLGKEIILVTLRLPYDISYFPEIKTSLAAYEYTDRSIKNVCKVLLGEIVAKGSLPIKNLV